MNDPRVTVTLEAEDAVWLIEAAYRAKIAQEAARNPHVVAHRERAARKADEAAARYTRVLDAFEAASVERDHEQEAAIRRADHEAGR